MKKKRASLLCVDDEPNVLEGLTLNLRRHYKVTTATSGAAGLEILQQRDDIAVIISDMRMPGMNGAEFLSQTRQVAPDAVRILLTGHSDITSAIAAINEGQIFRFLNKPCPLDMLRAAIDAGVEMHRLITAERVLLEQTLHGSIKTLTEVLALTNPVLFGCSMRIKNYASNLAEALGTENQWQIEVAAMLSQLGFVTLPAETAEKVSAGKPLSDAEQKMLDRAPALTEHLLSNIPRLESVRAILAHYNTPHNARKLGDDTQTWLNQACQILLIAVDFDKLEAQGNTSSFAFDTMRGRAGRYDPSLLAAFFKLQGADKKSRELREVALARLTVGMILAHDVKTKTGVLLMAKGYEITASFVARLRNFRPGSVVEPICVIVPRGQNPNVEQRHRFV